MLRWNDKNENICYHENCNNTKITIENNQIAFASFWSATGHGINADDAIWNSQFEIFIRLIFRKVDFFFVISSSTAGMWKMRACWAKKRVCSRAWIFFSAFCIKKKFSTNLLLESNENGFNRSSNRCSTSVRFCCLLHVCVGFFSEKKLQIPINFAMR